MTRTQGVKSDLNLGHEKVTLNHLDVVTLVPFSKRHLYFAGVCQNITIFVQL